MRFLIVICLCLLPFSLYAQSSDSSETEKGVLTRWLETNLSGAGREVRIEGFAGALSSTATLEKLTVADDQGIWITIENATLDWSRSALLRGNLEVEELTAQSIELVRWPVTDPATPSPEATEFKLPELPVAVQIKNVAADSLTLGESILGEAAVVSLSGQLELVSGQGTADIAIDRIDGKAGLLGLKAGYSNTTAMLNLALQVVEEEDGILVNLLNVPDRPSVDFRIEGSGPTSDFLARVALETNGAPRVTGEIQLLAETDPNGAVTNTFRTELSGDVATLLAERYREFVGQDSELKLAGALLPDKQFKLSEFQLKSAALDVGGTLALSADGLPSAFDILATINPVDGTDVALPISGSETRIKSATIKASFKAGESDEWTLDGNFLGLTRDAVSIEDAVVQASGLIQRVEAGDGLARRVTATVSAEVFGIDLDDPALSEAAGDSAKANVVMEWQEGNPIRIGFLDFTSGDLSIVGSGTVDGVEANLRVAGDVALRTGSLDRYAALAKQPIDGSAEIGLIGWYEPLGGAFEAALEGTTVALELGPTPLFDLVEGASTFNLDVKRDTGGIAIKTLALRAPGVTAELDGLLKTQASDLRASVSINDVSQVVAGISGPGNLSGTVRQSGPEWIVDFNGSGPGGSVFTATGSVAENFDTVDLEVKAAVPIGLANTFISAPIDIQGMANIDLAIRGAPSIDAVSGTISTTDTRIAAPAFSVTLRNVNATASIAGGLANLTMTGNFAGGGRVAVDGRVGLTPGYIADLQINLINAEFSDAQSYTANANGNLTLQGPLQGGASISGRIDVDEAEIRLAPPTTVVGIPDITHLNEAAAVARTRQRAGLQQTGETGDTAASAPLGLDVVISAPSRIFIRGRGLDTELGGRLRITGTTQDVIPIGQFSLVRGRLDILGKRLDMVEGQLLLQGSLNPRFRMVASTATTNATVRIITEGTAQAPSFTFESDPDLPDDEILANLLFGRSIATISPLQAAQLATAVATLTGSGGGGLFDRIREQFNLDDLDVTTDDNGAAALRLGKYLNENVYTDFSFSSDGTSQINLNLDVTPNVVAKGSASSDGATGLGIFFEKDY